MLLSDTLEVALRTVAARRPVTAAAIAAPPAVVRTIATAAVATAPDGRGGTTALALRSSDAK